MPEQDQGVLDARIRDLVARAVNDAPAAPDLQRGVVLETSRRGDRRGRWIGGGAAALAAAAAIVTAVVLVNDTDDRITTPATTPTAPPTTSPPIGPEALLPLPRQELVTAGPDGVTALDLASNSPRSLDLPAVRALPVGDGRVLVELGTPDAPGPVVVWNGNGETSDPLAGADLVGPMTIHDIAVIDGEPVLLYDIDPTATAGPDPTLYAAPITAGGIDLGDAVDLGSVGGPESGVRGLSLAANGLVVGESSTDGISALWVASLPGTPAAQLADELTPAHVGLEERDGPAGCEQCPAAFTVDGSGQRLGWIDAGGLVVTDISTGAELQRVPLGDAADGVADIDIQRDTYVLSYGPSGDQPPVIALPDGGQTVLGGFTADIGPGLGAGVEDEPVPNTTVASPDSAPATGLHVTGGPNGVAVWDAGSLVRRLDQPAWMSVLLPDGSVVIEPPSPDPRTGPSEVLVWRPDGTVEPFLPALPPGQSYRLHDAAEIAGVPTVLYSVATHDTDIDEARPGQTIDTELFTEVLHALPIDAAHSDSLELDRINTWEGGWSRLSLSDQGMIVGERYELTTTSLYVDAVPGSPADGTTIAAADLDVEPEYSECEDCPGSFAISPDGTTVAWVAGLDFVARTVATGETRRWSLATPELTDSRFSEIEFRTRSDGGLEAVAKPGSGEIRVGWFVLGPDGSVLEQPTDAWFVSFGP